MAETATMANSFLPQIFCHRRLQQGNRRRTEDFTSFLSHFCPSRWGLNFYICISSRPICYGAVSALDMCTTTTTRRRFLPSRLFSYQWNMAAGTAAAAAGPLLLPLLYGMVLVNATTATHRGSTAVISTGLVANIYHTDIQTRTCHTNTPLYVCFSRQLGEWIMPRRRSMAMHSTTTALSRPMLLFRLPLLLRRFQCLSLATQKEGGSTGWQL